ncbi:ATP-dependent RNA helicase ddx55, partial [Perkinsus olseni]
AVAAFVSFVRGYSEHELSFVFNIKELDLGDVATSFSLLRLPRVKEIMGRQIENFMQSEVPPDSVAYSDATKEAARQERLKKVEIEREERRKRREKIAQKQNVVRSRTEKRECRRTTTQHELDSLQREEALVKKLKKGKISRKQFEHEMKTLDGVEDDDDDDADELSESSSAEEETEKVGGSSVTKKRIRKDGEFSRSVEEDRAHPSVLEEFCSTAKIQRFWRSVAALGRTRKRIWRVFGERRLAARKLNSEGRGHRRGGRRIEVHLDGGMGSIFRIMEDKVDLVIVVEEEIPSEMMLYYDRLLRWRGIENPWGRVQILSVDSSVRCTDLVSSILCSPKLLSRLEDLLSAYEGRAMIVTERGRPITEGHLQLSGYLRAPLTSVAVGVTSWRIMMKKIVEENEDLQKFVPPYSCGPWNDVDDLIHEWSCLCEQYRKVCCKWMLEVDGMEPKDAGRIFVDFSSRRGARSRCHLCQGEYRQMLADELKSMPKAETLCNLAVRRGGVIRGLPSPQLASISVHMDIDEGTVRVSGTSEGIFHNRTPTCALIPHCTRPWGKRSGVVEELGRRVGEALGRSGIRGFASVELIVFMNPNFDEELAANVEDIVGSIGRSDLLDEGVDDGMFAALKSAESLCIDRVIDNVERDITSSLRSGDDKVGSVREYLRAWMAQMSRDGFEVLDCRDPINKFACWISSVNLGVMTEEVRSGVRTRR